MIVRVIVGVVVSVALLLTAACSASPGPQTDPEPGAETTGAAAGDAAGGGSDAGSRADAGASSSDSAAAGDPADDLADGGSTGLATAPRPSHEPAPVPPWPGTAYPDDDGHPDEAWIEALHSETVVFGCGDGNFCPDEPIAMAHLAELLYNLRFRSPDGHERPAIDQALADIAAVCRQGPSCFDQRVTAGQLALILVRAVDLPLAAATPDRFDDIDGHPAEQAIETVAAAGIVTGCDETSFCPDRRVTRSQAAAALAMALGLAPIPPRPVPWQLELVIGELEGGGTTDLRAPAGDDRLFVTFKGGTIRIVTGGRPEVWAYGLRNPWRFSFDGGNIYIGDVGHEHREEVSVAPAAGGLNYGWSLFEGTSCLRGTGCDAAGLVHPAVEYGRDDGVGVIGGYVYRGDAIPQMRGHYFYADVTGGRVRTFRWSGGEVTEHYDWSRAVERPESARFSWSFGVDGHGELYLLTRWAIWRIAPAS